ncbi:Transcriptional regulatory protein ZraR [Thermotalea metallivorans]|uniref:HTH-type transcriptional regulatory protein TyrR n=2 Tax=Thermotalea metallivorans TaxID=520762 RepID=A0A140KZF4_9FIRM|nr:Transcriptional regulatory protein ZraR [Thermotalea metallivorans]
MFQGVVALYPERVSADKVKMKNPVIDLTGIGQESSVKLNPIFEEIIGKSKVLEKALLIAQKASGTASTVLIRGESGTGKELVAKAIHYSSNRAGKPFVKINCGAIPSTLLESELFGHEQGAFTGAIRRRKGKFEQAHGGTIFLDEIGDMPLEMQVKLLRILQEQEFERVGGEETIKCDVRIIAATNRNLLELMEKEQFREDLYYRLNVIPIYLPALKERREDIPLLVRHFIHKICGKIGREIVELSEEAERCFYNYDWPGNIRELENLLERLIVLAEGNRISLEDLPPYIANRYQDLGPSTQGDRLINMNQNGEMATLEEYEKEIIRHAIKKFGSFNAAGKALGVTHKTVAFKARKYNIIE